LTQVDGSTEPISNTQPTVFWSIYGPEEFKFQLALKEWPAERDDLGFTWRVIFDTQFDRSCVWIQSQRPWCVCVVCPMVLSLGWYRNASNCYGFRAWQCLCSDPKKNFTDLLGIYMAGKSSKLLDDLILCKPYYTVVLAAGK